MPRTSGRRPRFSRATDNLPGFRLTSRDQQILRLLAEHRFLRSSHILSLIGGSRQGVLRRLAALFHHGYVDRPLAQLNRYYQTPGSEAMVYELSSRGAAFLRSCGLPFDEIRWSRKGANSIGTQFLEHALLVTDCLVSAELSCRDHDIRRISLTELNFGAGVTARSAGAWSVDIGCRSSIGVVPDAIFALDHGGQEQCLYFLEADRGTMPIRRTGLEQSSFHRKLIAYRETWKSGVAASRFGIQRFRVLTVTSSNARCDHLLDCCADLQSGQGLFLFINAEQLKEEEGFLRVPWRRSSGSSETLLA